MLETSAVEWRRERDLKTILLGIRGNRRESVGASVRWNFNGETLFSLKLQGLAESQFFEVVALCSHRVDNRDIIIVDVITLV